MLRLKLASLSLLAALSCAASTITTIGFEDWAGPGSDRDFNDTVASVINVDFHATGSWTMPSPLAYPLETPFPYNQAQYFDTATAAGGDIVATLLFQQTAANEHGWIKVDGYNGSQWHLINDPGFTFHNVVAGTSVSFRLSLDGGPDYYPAAGLNSDELPHAIFAGEEAAAAPEPVTMVMLGVGLIGLSLLKRRKAHER